MASLSAYRYEHPDDPFPEIDGPTRNPRCSTAWRLGHPLIPAARMVRNDVSLAVRGPEGPRRPAEGPRRNSSSSAGPTCPARARCCGPSASMRCSHSPALRCGPDGFASRRCASARRFASRTRCRRDARGSMRRSPAFASSRIWRTGPVPVLFLLDELLHGTNSHDRAVGAAGHSARAARSRRDRPDHDPRSRAHQCRRRLSVARVERPFRRPLRGRRDCVRLRHEAGPGHTQQRHRADAGRRPRCAGVTWPTPPPRRRTEAT